MPHRAGLIGLGIMGRRMLAGMSKHPEFEPAWGWDLKPEPRDRARTEFPPLRIAESAEELIRRPDVDLVYIATPPSTHLAYATAAAEAGKAVLCEKPLAAELEESRRAVELVRTRGVPNAVNFTFATSSAAATLEKRLRAGDPGRALRLELRFHFPAWPRGWQQGAAEWLAKRADGGFVREVVSHFVFLTHKLLGPLRVVSSRVSWPAGEGSETSIEASLDCGGLPVALSGQVGGAAPDYNEWTLFGSKRSFRLYDWSRLKAADASGWADLALDREPLPNYGDQLDAIARMARGEPHPLADFAAGLAVEEVIESLLRR